MALNLKQRILALYAIMLASIDRASPRLGRFLADQRAEGGISGTMMSMVSIVVGAMLLVIFTPILADQIVGANTTALLTLPGGSGAVTILELLGFLFVIGGVAKIMLDIFRG